MPASGSLCEEAIVTGKAIVTDDGSSYPSLRLLLDRLGSVMVVPLAAQGRVLGALVLGNSVERSPSATTTWSWRVTSPVRPPWC